MSSSKKYPNLPHHPRPGASGGGRGSPGGGRSPRYCTHCNTVGHTEDRCYQKHPELRPGEGPTYPPPSPQPIASSTYRNETTETDQNARLSDIDKYAAKNAKTDDPNLKQQAINNLGLRKSFAATGPKDAVITNFIQIKVPSKIYIYKVEMIRQYIATNQGTTQAVMVSRMADKKLVMNQVRQRVPELHPTSQRKWVTDNDLIWSIHKLFRSPPTGTTRVHQLPNISYDNECGQPLQVAEVNIFEESAIDTGMSMSELVHFNPRSRPRDSGSQILIRGLNAFLTDYARAQNDTHFTGGNKSYDTTTDHTLSQILKAVDGFFLSVRPGTDNLLMNINTATSPFYYEQSVDYCINNSGRTPRALNKILKGVKVRLAYDPVPGWPMEVDSNMRFIFNIGQRIDTETCDSSQNVNGRPITVHDWFARHYPRQHGHHPSYPAAQFQFDPESLAIQVATDARAQNPGNLEWYPAEFLWIVEPQAWHGDLSGNETSAMIHSARLGAKLSVNRITSRGLTMFGLNTPTQNNLLTNHRMNTETQLITVPASWLNPPNVRYNQPNVPGGYSAPIEAATWNLRDVHFVRPILTRQLLCLNLSSWGRDSKPVIDFCKEMDNAFWKHNMGPNGQLQRHVRVPQLPMIAIANARNTGFVAFETTLLNLINNLATTDPSAIQAVLIDERKDYEAYACVKRVADLQLGMHTVFCRLSNKKVFNEQQASNITLKCNLKGMGTNHHLGSQDFAAIRPTSGPADTIVIGADVTHPGAGSSPGTPSIAAVVGSTDDEFMHFPGSMRLQRARKEFIIELGDMVKERLIDWAKKHGNHLPSRVLFYRDGVSESQYEKLRTFEIPQIQRAFNWAQEFLTWETNGSNPSGPPPNTTQTPWPVNYHRCMDSNREPWPLRDATTDGDSDEVFTDHTGLSVQFQLTYVVVGKRHNTRFYAKNNEHKINPGRNENVLPGLLIDQVITHPLSFDFYLQSHNPIAGTGRSAHYFVLQNNLNLSTSELQKVTHDFCYAYARATRGVSYCAPAYYADRLCDRGRAYLRHWLTNKNNPSSQPSRARNNNETFVEYMDFVKNELRNRNHWRPNNNTANWTHTNPRMKYGFSRRNPWHEALDDVMFYL